MKKLFYIGILGLLIFELANVYCIMPMPGSQEMNSLDTAYFLYAWRWVFRAFFGLLLIFGWFKSSWPKAWQAWIPLVILGGIIYVVNFQMAADSMFYQPATLLMKPISENKVDTNRLVLGIVGKQETKAYPIRFIGYHHLVMDSLDGKPILITYCTVCRTGRVYEPIINGSTESFRLVGMDHFNAMFEDRTTGSWFRQASGEAVTGPLKGVQLPEYPSHQTSLADWIKLYPTTKIMQADPAYLKSYDTTLNYESGKSKKKLTGTDSLSWNKKSWVVGIVIGKTSKAYDWNRLVKERVIYDVIDNKPIMLVIGKNNQSFFAFERNATDEKYVLQQDSLSGPNHQYLLNGRSVDSTAYLNPIPAYQEFWHSWKTFHPATLQY
ncbi:MAG: hypothetical protein B7Y15_00705 [Bacteroidetes bacterium 24-39-8]|nr:MAG: hypothetical protein B7Y69_01605 [Sphingobacteriia bacterium 35-40-8]OYZ53078.1 MAG: hypothetical protein B7Y15_00705 [Bacteroidetes bacterium 24-39-8]OZA65353.1 MAG: hypothetical protein B7X72_07665 [Sphingobacteriia bacterium 39-39-8]